MTAHKLRRLQTTDLWHSAALFGPSVQANPRRPLLEVCAMQSHSPWHAIGFMPGVAGHLPPPHHQLAQGCYLPNYKPTLSGWHVACHRAQPDMLSPAAACTGQSDVHCEPSLQTPGECLQTKAAPANDSSNVLLTNCCVD
jgi:hypothetical protein